MKAYVACEDRILVQSKDKRILIFDKEGHIRRERVPKKLMSNNLQVSEYTGQCNSNDERYFLIEGAQHGNSNIAGGVAEPNLLRCSNNTFKFVQLIDEKGIEGDVQEALEELKVEGLDSQSLRVEQKFIMNDGKVLLLSTVQVNTDSEVAFFQDSEGDQPKDFFLITFPKASKAEARVGGDKKQDGQLELNE